MDKMESIFVFIKIRYVVH